MMVVKMMSMQNMRVGVEVTCPKCGKRGKVGIDKFRAGDKEYFYWTVRHYEGRRVRRCIVGRVEGAVPAVETRGETVQASRGAGAVETPKPAVQAPAEPGVGVEGPRVVGWRVEEFAVEESIPEWERKAWWYVVKVNASWGSFRENPSEENFKRFVNTVQDIAQRVGVPCHYVMTAAEHFYKTKSGVATGAVNNAMQWFSRSIMEAMKRQAKGTETAVQAAPVAPQPVFNIEEVRKVVREEVAKAVETIRIPQAPEVRVEVPREVVETIAAVRNQIVAMQKEIEYIREQVRQRKGWGARAVVRGERKIEFREGNMYWMIREVMRGGGEWTKEAIVDEIKRKFGKVVSGNSVSGRISEMAAAGHVVGRR
ncbi:MAG: hypothetical protein LM580_11025, partial [Thermofilum sp.]|nr:hypothetical protein [Thermofilum sp.]